MAVKAHYTSQNGMLGILKSQSIWATNIKYVNDENEFDHALRLIEEIIPTAKIDEQHRDYELYQEFQMGIEQRLSRLDTAKTENVYTFSFSNEGDLLSQWRGYCADGSGYCLEIEAGKILERARNIYDSVHLMDCVYKQNEKDERIRQTLNDGWLAYNNATSQEEKRVALNRVEEEIILLASYFKHPSFSEEKEQRLVIILEYAADEKLEFRNGRYSLIPYIEIPISLDTITSIRIGPTLEKRLAERSLSLFLENLYGNPFSAPTVELSTVPYRPA